jgi:prepilin-type N-terminal cleavage/methylation domain-containing protein
VTTRRISNSQEGFTLVEMLVAMAVLLIGIVATFGVFAASKNASLVAQRHEVAVHQAQREMERLRAFRYSELGLTSAPATSSDPNNPNYRVQASNKFRSKTSPVLDEDLVINGVGGYSGGLIDPGPESFTVGETSGAVTGKVYRYITWRDENCTTCTGSQNTKRLFVAVTIDAIPGRPGIGPQKPIWLSSIVIDPNDGPPGGGGGAPGGPNTSAQTFYLYDKTCSNDDANNGYTAPTGSGATNDTAAPGTSCENATASQRPDLMGPTVPSYSNPPVPPWTFSSDIPNNPPAPNQAATYPAGLALSHTGAATSCPSSYALDTPTGGSDGNLYTPGKWQVHAWSTKKFGADFNLSGTAFLSIWTTSVGSTAGAGRFCATLIDRTASGGAPTETVVGATSRTYSPWPTTKTEPGRSCGDVDFPCGRQLTFQFSLSGASITANDRMVLVIGVLGTSDKDIVLLYDDPRYRSLIQVGTTTPCNSTGLPCPTS